MKKETRKTIEKNYLYHLYYFEGVYFVDYYGDKADGYATEAAAREALYYHFN